MKRGLTSLLAALMLLTFAACGASETAKAERNSYVETAAASYGGYGEIYDGYYDYPSSGENLNYYAHEQYDEDRLETPAQSAEPQSAESGQKLIRKLRLTVETDDYQVFVDTLKTKLLALGGYIEDMEANTSGRTPSATIVLRVPADQLSALTDSVSGIGNVTYKHESQQDVTLQYTDTESHIAALRTEQERLLQLLEKAESLSEILEIEDRMTYVRYELENYERSLRALSNQVSYATATIEVRQVEVFTPMEEPGYWEKLGDGISDSVNGLWDFAKELFRGFVVSLPYLIVFLVLPLIILLVLVKRIRRKLKAKKAAKQAQTLPEAEPEAR